LLQDDQLYIHKFPVTWRFVLFSQCFATTRTFNLHPICVWWCWNKKSPQTVGHFTLPWRNFSDPCMVDTKTWT